MFDEELDQLVEFYDFDFRDPNFIKQFNTS